VYKLFETVNERDKFNKAASREMRGQSGQRDRFLEALRTSGFYQEHFLRIFQERGLPLELTWIPFVESYYNYKAYSRAGAAGVWQFIPSTARLYGLRMNTAVDERYDPIKSAMSAADLLNANYEMFQSWPLAITAYNHGNAGMLRAVRELGTTDFGKIATRYRGPGFGFYSRNYYAEFLAVAQIMREAETHFGDIELFPPVEYEEITLTSRMYLNDMSAMLNVSKELLASLNRDLKRATLQSKTPIPKGFVLKLPLGKKEVFLTTFQAQAAR
jgi:membrane-bound lytic murein transglycosylase D